MISARSGFPVGGKSFTAVKRNPNAGNKFTYSLPLLKQ